MRSLMSVSIGEKDRAIMWSERATVPDTPATGMKRAIKNKEADFNGQEVRVKMEDTDNETSKDKF